MLPFRLLRRGDMVLDDPHVVFAKMCPDDMTVRYCGSRFLFSSVAVSSGMMILPGRKNPPHDST